MKKLFLILILGMFMLSFTQAQINYLGGFRQGECVTIKQSCSTCTYVNLSVSYPNSTIAVLNKGMSPQGAGLWTYEFCNTSAMGRYDIAGEGDINGGLNSFDILWFDVTASGTNPTTAQGILYGLLLLASMFFLIICLYGAFAINGDNEFSMGGDLIRVNFNKYYKGFLFLLAYLFAIFTSYLSWQISSQFLFLDLGTAIFKTTFNVLLILLTPIIILLIIVGFVKWLADVELHKLAERGLKPR